MRDSTLPFDDLDIDKRTVLRGQPRPVSASPASSGPAVPSAHVDPLFAGDYAELATAMEALVAEICPA